MIPNNARLKRLSLILLVLLVVIAGIAFMRGEIPRPNTHTQSAPSAPAPVVVAAAPASAPSPTTSPEPIAAARNVGSASCAQCHTQVTQEWKGSDHDLAMMHASPSSVVGDFNNATFNYNGIESKFYTRDGKYYVLTDGEDGKLAEFEIQFTFGIYPLQQYLVGFPDGRYQTLSITWDARPKEQGGQHWYHMYPDEKVDYKDELHWTRRMQNWNHMCAECHSTNVKKNFDPVTRTYHTHFDEINVSCESCHGPGSRHEAWANKELGWEKMSDMGLDIRLNERKDVRWIIDPATGNAERSEPRTSNKELEMCARCHARRGEVSEDYHHGKALMDTHHPALLTSPLYHPDGQIEDEVYEYASFLQSKMHQEGVSCSDCHNPHTLKLRAPGENVCMQCHAATKYQTPVHTHHPQGSEGASCLNCHMTSKVYMGVDLRRDHSFRIPRPDLSIKTGSPNACNACHKDKTAQWAADTIRTWTGHEPKGRMDYAETLYAARTGAQGAEQGLTQLINDYLHTNDIVRATATTELGNYLSQNSLATLASAVHDESALVRMGAASSLETLPMDMRWQLGKSLLSDPMRSVRIAAVGLLAGTPPTQMTTTELANFNAALKEFMAEQQLNADLPETHVNLGNMYAAEGKYTEAEQAYRKAIEMDDLWAPAYANLADLLRKTQRETESEAVLQQGILKSPKTAALHYALGLLNIRQKNLAAAINALQRAAELAPQNTQFTYVYALALSENGQKPKAMQVIEQALKAAPGDRSLNALRVQLAQPATGAH
jgi:predicted CXXCH cytochrome family protein